MRRGRQGTLAVVMALGATWAVLSAHGQEAGLPLPPPRDAAAPSAPATPTAPVLDLPAGFRLEANAWRVAGRDAAGEFTGTITFQRRGPRYFVYERRVRAGTGHDDVERGEAAISDGRLYLQATAPDPVAGLRRALAGAPGAGEAAEGRRAVFRLMADGRRFEGRFAVPGTPRAGVERLEPIARPGADNHVTLLVDGPEMFPALRAAIEGAQRTICLQTYIFTDDSTGRWVTRLLVERARAGVKVRVLVDAFGNRMGGLPKELRAGGVELILQHTMGQGLKNSVVDLGRGLVDGVRRLFGGQPKPRERRGVLNHDHRKIIVVDSRLGFCGGMNIGREYEFEWHDVHATVEGSAVATLEALFFDRWRAAGGTGEAGQPLDAPAAAPGTMSVDVVEALPGITTAIKDRYLAEIRGARDRVLVECAYFLDDSVIAAMNDAARRRVRTVLIVPGDEGHDVPIVRDAFRWVENDVVRAGVELYKYQGRMVHSKVASFDGRVATVGSSNLDNLALVKLAEANLFVNDVGFTRTLDSRVFAPDMARSIRQGVRKLSWWEKVKSGTLHFFRGVL
ncbi:MAG: phosphatidylserine/phosphatidylglycerophosphate/cardiolipin synthase family protein [Planctomycetes bacterium]|nr:phosphatidylserine/phosphatidylglycerophosphate/cardiolipin synthase family protein [Planctomycetota bacterium]